MKTPRPCVLCGLPVKHDAEKDVKYCSHYCASQARKTKNAYWDHPETADCVCISLRPGIVALVDKRHSAAVRAASSWRAAWQKGSGSFYAQGQDADRRTMQMGRVVAALEGWDLSLQVDHVGHSTLDNRVTNLRMATPTQQLFNQRIRQTNTSGFKGVSWHSTDKAWVARIAVNGRRMFLGNFDTPAEAGAAYEKAAKTIAGEFLCLKRRPAEMEEAR